MPERFVCTLVQKALYKYSSFPYNFGCITASDTLFDCIGAGFRGQATDEDSRDQASKGRCHGNQFWD